MSLNLSGAPAQRSDYRADIDGLRAVAIIAVVLFHAFPAICPGGFIGVDIFFVISGYLISKHIWEELTTGDFSIKTFYARRARRIFPALGVVLTVCLLFGWLILSPSEYEQLGKHAAGGAGFVSNFLFWKEAGYFDNAADTKPLLHLWSLGIEEQFYLLWPIVLGWLWRRPHHAWWALPAMLFASFAYNLHLAKTDTTADFYSPLTRFWELAIGASLSRPAVMALNKRIPANMLGLAGIALLLIGFTVIDSQAAFPGYWAIFPVLGAACLILAGENAWPNAHVLSLKGMVWFGLISYPLYLWHWPLLSFARIMESATPELGLRIGLVIASILLAWLTYWLVERPIRARSRSRWQILSLSLFMVALLVSGLVIRKLDGISSRKLSMLNGDPATLTIGADRGEIPHNCGLQEQEKPLFQFCYKKDGAAPFLVLGDSKAEALYYGLARQADSGRQWSLIGTVYPPSEHDESEPQHTKNVIAYEFAKHDPESRFVVIATALRKIFPVNNKEVGFIAPNTFPTDKFDAYHRAITELEQAGKRVVFVIDNPTFPDPKSCISGGLTSSATLNSFLRRKENPLCTLDYSSHLAGTHPYREFVEKLVGAHPNMIIFDPTPLLCDIPNGVCRVTENGNFLYSYGDHLSDYSNSIVGRELIRQLSKY